MSIIIAIVENVTVEALSATAVRVSWNSVAIPEITGYIVYYSEKAIASEMSITVNSSMTSVDIEDLLKIEKYQFQVAAIAEVNESGEFIGERSEPSSIIKSNESEIIIIVTAMG